MPDDKTKTTARDHSRAGSQDYEVTNFARHNGISLKQARNFIKQFGNCSQAPLREAAPKRSG